jgi:hypothetical protein
MNAINTESTEQTGGALVIFEQAYTPAALFAPGAVDPLLDRIKAEVAKEVTDPSTPAGRKRIISLAMKVTKTKTAIEAERVRLVSDEKKRLAAIDAEGRRIRESLDALAEEVRQPVTDWENRDKARIAAHEAGVLAFQSGASFEFTPSTDDIAQRLASISALPLDGFEEFAKRAEDAKAAAVAKLEAMLDASRKADAERAELERLRREAAEREQREREEAIAAKARAEAEAEARRREEEAARAAEMERQRIARDAAERETAIKAEAEAKERAAAEAAARAKREQEEAEARAAKAEADRIESERRAKEAAEAAARKAEEDRIAAEAAAKRREEEAAERERQRIEAERLAEAEAAAKREADKAHKAKINNEALTALVAAGLSEGAAKAAISAIAKGMVPNVKISY